MKPNTKTIFRQIASVIFPPIGYILIRFFWLTARKELDIQGSLPQNQCIIVSWHEALLFSPQIYRYLYPSRKASAIISRHFDGEIIAGILKFLHLSPLRGSSSKGGARVLLEAVRTMRKGEDILLTPDGPRGPRHQISEGVLALHRKSKAPIVSLAYIPSRYHRLQSWDRFIIPRPFSRIKLCITVINSLPANDQEAQNILYKAMMRHYQDRSGVTFANT